VLKCSGNMEEKISTNEGQLEGTAMRILILEDNDLLAKFIGTMLNDEGIQCDVVNTYSSAMGKLGKHYDWIIADYFLQGGGETGVDFVEEYKKKNSRTKVLIYSANMDKIESDAVDKIIYKTVHADELINFIKTELKEEQDCAAKCSSNYEIIEIRRTLEELRGKYCLDNSMLLSHDKKIAIFETNLENFKVSFQKLEDKVDNVSKSISAVDKSMEELTKKQASSSVSIILWVAGIVLGSFAAVMGIIYEMIKNLIK